MRGSPARKYDAYKPSGIGWLGEVPVHWSVDRLKWSVDGCFNGVWGDEPDGVNDLMVVRVADFDRSGRKVSLENPTYRSVPKSARNGRILMAGDLLIEKSGGGENQPVGTVVKFDHDIPAVCSNFVARVPVKKGFDSSFLCYLHSTLYNVGVNVLSIKQNTGIQNLDSSAYFDEKVGLPPLEEQQCIARYLDREAAKIDLLISKQKRLIELLEEKRKSIISETVFLGLDPNVQLREFDASGILAVPKHWNIKKFRYLGKVNPPPGTWYGSSDDEAEFFPMDAVGEKGELDRTRYKPYRDAQKGYSSFSNGDVVVAKVTPCFENGKGALISGLKKDVGFGSTELTVLRPGHLIDAHYFYLLMMSNYVRQLGASEMFGAGGLKRVPDEFFRNLFIPVPPIHEQEGIVASITQKITRIELLLSKASAKVELLKERRANLIHEAVTGKIDVRGLV